LFLILGTFALMKAADVYWAVSETPGWMRLLAARDALDDGERARMERLAFAVDREAFVAGHALLRFALCAHAGGAAGDWRFVAASSGKPELAGPARGAGLTFSLSHARTIVACAVSCDGQVGVDVEAVNPANVDEALVSYAFAPAERALLERFPPAQRPVAFARLWTLKEAVLKVCGAGAMQAIECGLDPPRLVRVPGEAEATVWALTSLLPTEGHALALARAGGATREAVVRQVAPGDP